MSEKKKKKEEKKDFIPQEILDSISSIDPEALVRIESCPAYPLETFDISEMLEGRNKKKEEEKEYKIGNYLIKKTLGQGTFGKVKLGIYLPSQEKVAIKILEKERIVERDDEIRVKREFDMLSIFNHPNVILVAEIFESHDKFYSVMEYCDGGELFNFIVKNRRLSEEEAAFFYYQLIKGLEYIHSLGIVHRDLKPENLLLTKEHLLKIIDFGLSNYFKKGQKDLLITPCGSPCYASPEMVAGKKYDGFKIDIWSSGIILFAMLCGYLPFEDKDNEVLFEKILECKLEFPDYVTEISKDIIEKILVNDPDKRITIPEIKNHPFYIKGKELFEQEFSICEMDKEDDDNEDTDLSIFFDNNNTIIQESNKNNNKKDTEEKEKENKNNNIDKKKNKKKLSSKDLNQKIINERLNTEYDENNHMRNDILKELDNNESNQNKKRNNSSMKKKNINRNKIKNKNNIYKNNDKIEPFKKRDILILKYNKNNGKNSIFKGETKLKEKIKLKDFSKNKKLIKTDKYKNIAKNKVNHKKNDCNSVNIRNVKYKKNVNKNLVHRKINYTNILQNKFNSKENITKKDNIYINNLNNTIDDECLSNNKKHLNPDLYNISVKKTKKTFSVAKKNPRLTPLETANNKKNQKFLDYIFNIHSSIKKYEDKLNNNEQHNQRNNNNINIRLSKFLIKNNHNANKKEENSIQKNKENKSIINQNKNNIKTANVKKNNINMKNKNIIGNDNTENKNLNIKSYLGKNNNKNSPKNNDNYIKPYKDKIIKKNTQNINHIRLLNHNSNIHNNQGDSKINYYPNEINQTIDEETNKTHHYVDNTDIFDNFEYKKNNNKYNLKKKFLNNYKKKFNSNKTEILEKEKKRPFNKEFIFDNSIIKSNNNALNTIDNSIGTEPNKKESKPKKLKKINNKYNNYNKEKVEKDKDKNKNNKNIIKPNNIFSNYIRNFNKTSNNFNTLNSSTRNPFNSNNKKYIDVMNTSGNYNANSNNSNLIKKIVANNRKNSQINSNNIKKPSFTIKNTVINVNIDAGLILSTIQKNRKAKKNSKRGANNSISQINNNHLYELNNNYLTQGTITSINHSNTNENIPTKKSININDNYNIFPLYENTGSNDNYKNINKNSDFQKIYIYDENNDESNIENKNKKENKIKNNSINNKSLNIKNKKHMKYKSMKLEEF